jgi:hypothetical protein
VRLIGGGALLAYLATAAVAQSGKLPGTWQYDLSSIRLELNATIRKEMADPKKAKEIDAVVAQLKQTLAKQLRTMKLVFEPNHRVTVYGGDPPHKAGGHWSMKGQVVTVVMDDRGRPSPRMELDKTGKRIHVLYADARFGAGKADLVKR